MEAFPWDIAPRYLIRDRDSIFGQEVRRRIRAMDIEEVVIAPRSPWQSPYVERLIGGIRRDCLDHVIVLSEKHLKRLLGNYIESYYHRARTHLSLANDCPLPRPVQAREMGTIVALPEVGGLHQLRASSGLILRARPAWCGYIGGTCLPPVGPALRTVREHTSTTGHRGMDPAQRGALRVAAALTLPMGFGGP